MGAFEVYASRMNNMFFGKNLISHGKVLYEDSDRREIIKHHILRYVNYLLKDNELNKDLKLSLIKNNAFVFCAAIYSGNRIFSKNSSFIDEDEVRMYYQENNVKESLELLDSMKNDIPHELYKNTRKSYLEMVEQYNLNNNNFYLSKYGIRSYIDLILKEILGLRIGY